MQIFKGSQEQLKEKFHLNPLIVMWVGILRSKQIFLTEPVLELCKTDGPLEVLFKDRTIIATLNDQREFNHFQQQHGSYDIFPLTILDNGTEKVIALQDELLAEEGWGNSKAEVVNQSSNNLMKTNDHLQGVEHLLKKKRLPNLK